MKKVLLLTLSIFALSFYLAFAGDVEIKPYGFILVNGNYNDGIKADIPFRAALADTFSNFLITARQTRFGFKMSYEATWKVTGNLEMDFFGLKGSGANGGVMQSAPRLRLAYFKITKNDLSLLFGQDWTILAPLSPTSMMHVSIPEFSSSGNLWNRYPQLRVEYKAKLDDKNSLLFQGALLRPLGADITPTVNQTDELGAGELAGLPFIQGRVSANIGTTATIGASAHFGQEDFFTAMGGKKKVIASIVFDTLTWKFDTTYTTYDIEDKKTTTMAVAGDLKVKANIVTLSGEGFWGENLAMLFSNAHLRSELTGGKYEIKGVQAMGGWGEVSIKPTNSKFTFGAGGGIEILKEAHVDSFFNDKLFTSSTPLWKNMTIFATVIYTPLDKVSIGLEFNNIKSTYKKKESGNIVEKDADDNSASLAFKFDF
jgi:hypothetical protein